MGDGQVQQVGIICVLQTQFSSFFFLQIVSVKLMLYLPED